MTSLNSVGSTGGSATNNDGARKTTFSAWLGTTKGDENGRCSRLEVPRSDRRPTVVRVLRPSYEGQVEVIRQAHLDAGILSHLEETSL